MRFCNDVTVFDVDRGAERFESLQVLIDGARTDLTAAWERYLRAPMTSNERPKDEHTRAHLTHELVRRFGARRSICLRQPNFGDVYRDVTTEEAEERRGRVDIAEPGDVAQTARSVGEQGRAKDGERSIFRAANTNAPVQRFAATDSNRIHRRT
jgi:hypothetical protein